jgi:hypothetical protein
MFMIKKTNGSVANVITKGNVYVLSRAYFAVNNNTS